MRQVILAGFLALFCLSLNAIAADKVACTSLKIKAQDKSITLPGKSTPQIYFLKNTSEKSVWIDHPVKRSAGASAGWAAYVSPGSWSALVIYKKGFALTCATIQPGKVDYLDCSHIISICTPPQVKDTARFKSSHWLSENKTWDELLKALEKRGVVFSK